MNPIPYLIALCVFAGIHAANQRNAPPKPVAVNPYTITHDYCGDPIVVEGIEVVSCPTTWVTDKPLDESVNGR